MQALLSRSPSRARFLESGGIIFARGLNNQDGRFSGVVLANMGLEKIGATLSKLSVGQEGGISLRDEKLGLILSSPNAGGFSSVGETKISAPFQAARQRNLKGGTYVSGATSVDGVSRIHSYAKLDRYPFFYLNVGLSEKEVFKGWRDEVISTVSTILSFKLIIAFGSWLLLRSCQRREENEARIKRLSLFYESLSLSNEAIVRCFSEQELFVKTCSLLADRGGLTMVWIGIVDESTSLVRPVASNGDKLGYLDNIRISVDAKDSLWKGP